MEKQFEVMHAFDRCYNCEILHARCRHRIIRILMENPYIHFMQMESNGIMLEKYY